MTPIKSLLEPYSNNPAYRMYLYDTSDFGVMVRTEKKKFVPIDSSAFEKTKKT